MQTKSFSFTTIDQLTMYLESIEIDIFNPNLAICFVSPKFDIQVLVDVFMSKNIMPIGSTTAGEIFNEGCIEDSFSVLLLEIDSSAFQVILKKGDGTDLSNISEEIGKEAMSMYGDPGLLIYGSGVGVNGGSIVRGFNKVLINNSKVFGGLAGDYMSFKGLKIFSENRIVDNGILALILDQRKVEINGWSYSGWDELGKLHKITKSKDNIIYEVDQKPALDLFRSYFLGVEFKPKNEEEKLFTIPGIYPLKVKNAKKNTEYLRSIMMYDFKNNAIILAADVEEGSDFRFCPTPAFGIIDTTVNAFQQYATSVKSPDAVILNTCVCRKFAFGPLLNEEVEGIYNIWNKPLVGYMAYGEIGPVSDSESCSFHNATSSVVTLRQIDKSE